jgi:hypothetical protein
MARSTDAATWESFGTALAWYQANRTRIDGIGFVFATDDAFAGIDLDDCRDPQTGAILPWAIQVIAAIGSYAEISPSGTGVKLFVKGRIPAGGNRKGNIEMYDSGRYFAVTGRRLENAPATVEPRQAELDQLHARIFNGPEAAKNAAFPDEEIVRLAGKAANGEKFRRLWAGEVSCYGSASEADLALCGMLAFWTGPDAARIDAMFRRSGLMRAKWDEKRGDQTYGQLTIAKALAGRTDFYSGASRADRNGHGAGAASHPKKPVPTLEPYRPFPVEALPAPLAEYVCQAASALGCDPAYVALPCLAVAAGLIGYTRVLRLKRTWRAPSVLWTLIIADSGSLKTPAFRHATDYLFLLQKRLDAEYKRKVAEYLEAKEKWAAAAKAAKDGKGVHPGDEPEPPIQKTIFTSDATIEAIAELIGDNPRGLVVSCDELAGWLNSFSRYKGKAGGTDLPRWLSMHSAGGFAYHRKTGDRRRIVVPHAAVSIAGGIQPDILARAIAGDFVDSGGFARILPAMPPRPGKVWSETEIDPDTEKRYHSLLEALYALEFDDGEPYVLKLSPEAKACWVRWYEAWGREQAATEGELAAAFSKLEEAAARFTLIHHVVTRFDRNKSDLGPVEVESMEAGIALARWFGAEAKRVYAVLAEDEEQRTTRRLVEHIRAHGGRITARELQRSNSRKYPTAEAAEAALEQLVTDGLGLWEPPITTAKGGQPARYFRLHPTHDSTDTTGNAHTDAEKSPPDTTPDSTSPAPVFSGENPGSVGSVMRRTEAPDTSGTLADDGKDSVGSVGRGEVVSDTDCDGIAFGPDDPEWLWERLPNKGDAWEPGPYRDGF